MHDGVAYHSQLLPAANLKLENPKAKLAGMKNRDPIPAVIDDDGSFKFFTIALQTGQIFITAKNHAPMLVDFNAQTLTLPQTIQLKAARTVKGKITYPANMHHRFKKLKIYFGNQQQFAIESSKIDDQGNWQFTNIPADEPVTVYAEFNRIRIKLAEIPPTENDVQLVSPSPQTFIQPTTQPARRRGASTWWQKLLQGSQTQSN